MNLKWLGFLTLAFLLFSSVANAKMISGKISAVDSATRKISIATTDPVSGQEQTLNVWVNADAKMSGLTSFVEMNAGDMIWVDATEDSEGNLRVTTLTKS